MDLLAVRNFIRECTKDELSVIIHAIKTRQKNVRDLAKSQFSIGDRVTSDHWKWIWGDGTVEKINRKNLVIRTSSGLVNASPALIKKVLK